MAVKRISVNWTIKLHDSKDLTKYGNSSDGQINPQYPNGIMGIRGKLEAEGHTVIQKGKRFLVEDFQRKTGVPKLK